MTLGASWQHTHANKVDTRLAVDVTKSDASSVGGGLESKESVSGTASFTLGDFGTPRVSKKQRVLGHLGAKSRQCLLLAAAALGLLMMEGDVGPVAPPDSPGALASACLASRAASDAVVAASIAGAMQLAARESDARRLRYAPGSRAAPAPKSTDWARSVLSEYGEAYRKVYLRVSDSVFCSLVALVRE